MRDLRRIDRTEFAAFPTFRRSEQDHVHRLQRDLLLVDRVLDAYKAQIVCIVSGQSETNTLLSTLIDLNVYKYYPWIKLQLVSVKFDELSARSYGNEGPCKSRFNRTANFNVDILFLFICDWLESFERDFTVIFSLQVISFCLNVLLSMNIFVLVNQVYVHNWLEIYYIKYKTS